MKRQAYFLFMTFVMPLMISAQTETIASELAELDASMAASTAESTNIVPNGAMQTTTGADAQSSDSADVKPATVSVVLPAQSIGETEEFTPLSTATVPSDGTASSNLITIALDDVELIDVVRMISHIANANIIATPSNLSARVTANLDAVEWKPALATILSMHQLALVERPQGSGVYSITAQGADTPEPMIVETIFLDYTTVEEVIPVIEKMLAKSGSISTFPSRNAMVIRSTEANQNEIRLVVKSIDIMSQQVCIETQFMELNDSAIKQLGIRWDSLEQLGVGFQAGPFVSQDSKERTSERSDAIRRADGRLASDALDQRANMYGDQYQVEVVQVTEIDGASPEITRDYLPTRHINRAVNLTQDASSDIADTFTRTITESSAAILNIDSLNVVLSALQKTDGVSIVSNPKVIVANGTTNAFFRVGQREPIIRTTTRRGTTDSPGDEVTADLDTTTSSEYIRDGYLHTGIELKVIPIVKVDNLIEAQIEPSLRRKIGEKTVERNSWPIISVKEIKTKFTLESGQTVAIGGLTDTTDSKRTSKIPLLGDIPIIGKYLFSHTRDEKSQVETIIFVSLTLVEPRNLMPDQGIPEKAELVHKARIRDEIRKRDVEEELRVMRKASQELEKRRHQDGDHSTAE